MVQGLGLRVEKSSCPFTFGGLEELGESFILRTPPKSMKTHFLFGYVYGLWACNLPTFVF